MADEILRYEMVLFAPDGGAQFGMFEQVRADGPTSFGSVLASIGHLLDANNLKVLEFPNPESPLHWHVLFWDAEGLTKGLPLNKAVLNRMREVSADFPDIYGRAALVRDKFWSDDTKPDLGGKH